MATPVFNLPVAGSDPKVTSATLLEGEVNRVVESLLSGSLSAAALGVAWPRVTTTAAGLAATVSGQMFVLANVGNSLAIYLNNAGTAVLQATLPDQSAVLAAMRFEQRWSYLTRAALSADTVLTYGAGVVGTVAVGARVQVGRFAYVVDWSASTTYHMITTGGVKLVLQRDLARFDAWKRGLSILKLSNDPFVLGISGQSNHGSNDDNSGNRATNAAVQIWNGTAFVLSQPGVSPLAFTYNIDGTPYAKPNEFIHWLACRIQEETGRAVHIIMDCRGSTPISQWKTDWATTDNLRDMFGAFNARAVAALANLGLTKLDAMIWTQGESNSLTLEATYKADFFTVWARFHQAAWFDANRPFLTVEMPRDTIYAIQNSLYSEFHRLGIPSIYTVSTEGLAVDSSGVHYTGGALQEIGYERCFDGLMQHYAHPQPYDTQNPYLPFGAAAGHVTPSQVPPGSPLAASGALDILLSAANGGLVAGGGAGGQADPVFKGRAGYRTVGPAAPLSSGTAITLDTPGGRVPLLGAHALPLSAPKGHTITVCSAIEALVTVSASGGGNILMDNASSSSIFLRMKDDCVTLRSDGSNNWTIVADSRMSRARSLLGVLNGATVTIKTPGKSGYVRVWTNRGASAPNPERSIELVYNAGTTPGQRVVGAGSLATGVIGTASRINVACVTTDQIDLQNNSGSTMDFHVEFS